MRRRDFLAAATTTTSLAALGPLAAGLKAQEAGSGGRQYLLLARYLFDDPAQQKKLLTLLADAGVAALNRAGVEPVGVFTPAEADVLDVWVLLAHADPAALVNLGQRMGEDSEFLAAADDYLNTPFDQPVFQRYESSLLFSLEGMPRVQRPAKGDERVFQLRIYESPTELAGYRKVEMFNDAELAIFRRVGLTPVFFGQALIGTKLPNLTYMLGFDNEQAKDAGWEKFLADPAWEQLKGQERYKQTVSNITNIVLKPASCSQI